MSKIGAAGVIGADEKPVPPRAVEPRATEKPLLPPPGNEISESSLFKSRGDVFKVLKRDVDRRSTVCSSAGAENPPTLWTVASSGATPPAVGGSGAVLGADEKPFRAAPRDERPLRSAPRPPLPGNEISDEDFLGVDRRTGFSRTRPADWTERASSASTSDESVPAESPSEPPSSLPSILETTRSQLSSKTSCA